MKQSHGTVPHSNPNSQELEGDHFDTRMNTARGLVNGTALSVLLWIALIAWVVA